MAGYIGSKASVVSSGAERKKVFDITTSTTELTGLSYTANQVHVFHNGVRLISGTDYTETNDTTITLTNAAENGDQVVVVSYASFQTSDTVSASAGGTFSGAVDVNADGATVLTVDRATSDGTIIDVQKNGSSVGSIGTYLSTTYIGSGNANLMCNDVGAYLAPSASGGAVSDSVLDLGAFNRRFKDLYLSGGLYVGGTGSANKLEDYEEGTWTPVISSTGTAPTVSSYTYQAGTYTKMGRVVVARCRIRATLSAPGGGTPLVTGLPFANTGGYSGVSMGLQSLLQLGSSTYNRTIFNQGASYGTTTSVAFYDMSYVTGSTPYLEFTITYDTA